MQNLSVQEHIYFTETILKYLAQNRITSVLDFLQEDVEKLAVLTKLNLSQILDIRHGILQNYSAPLINGTSLLENSNKYFQKTNINRLDAALHGGLPIGCITEVCGLAGCGKTQLCLQLAINCVKDSNNTVLYIDTKGDFSAIRVQKILDSCGYSYQEMAMIMHKLRVVYIWNMDVMLELFRKLKNEHLVIQNVSLIIIDSLPSLMFQYFGDENKIGLSLLNVFVNYLRFISKKLSINIICVNIQTRWVDQDVSDLEDDGDQALPSIKDTVYVEKQNRCLGKYWQNIPSTVLFLDKTKDNNLSDDSNCSVINISIRNSSNPKNCTFCLLNLKITGVVE